MALSVSPLSLSLAQWSLRGLLALSCLAAVPLAAVAQASGEASSTPASEVRRIDVISTTEFSMAAADALVAEANGAIAVQDYGTAIEKLTAARQIYDEMSGYYQELASMFFGVDTRQNRSNRDMALAAAQKRDETTYQLALLHRMEGHPEKAVPLLMAVLRSQQPTRDLGKQAYQQLYEMGFVEAPYEGQ